MKSRKKILIAVGVLLLAAIVFFPVQPKYGDRPVMSHRQWEKDADKITKLLSAYENQERASDAKMIQVNVDQLTGLHGYSILGGEALLGRRSSLVVGYLTEQDAAQFYREGDEVWVGLEDITKLQRIAKES